jgi:thiosulfate/3-mercaptopyruvate sulfurtransferase
VTLPLSPLIDPSGLVAAQTEDHHPVLLDVRWSLARPDGHPEFLAAHLPGARYLSLETELTGPPSPAEGRHPLPRPDRLQAALRRLGVCTGHPVVVYDDSEGLSAARAWWVLRWAGHDAVQVLDGGLGAWRRAGRDLEAGEPGPAEPGDVVVRAGSLPVVSTGEVAHRPPDRLLIDSRAPERYRGEVEPVDPVAGHIPGAVNLPTTDNLDGHGRLLAPDTLRSRFSDVGADTGPLPPIVSCGSGVTAAHQLLAMAVAGLDGVLYPASWSGWVADPAAVVATGPNPD